MKEILKEKIVSKLEKLGIINFLNNLEKYFELKPQFYLVGGAIRDVVRSEEEGIKYEPDDIDIVVVGGDLEKALGSMGVKSVKTLFGGFRIFLNKTQVDIWKAEKTIRIVPDPNLSALENYFNDLYLNTDRIVFDLKTQKITDDGCIEGVQNKQIEIKFSGEGFNPTPMDLSRVISLKKRLDYKLGDDLKAIIKTRRNEVIEDIKLKAKRNNYTKEKTEELISIVKEI